jgi:hypothetical protein
MREACLSCGARSVGEPLPRPEHELPSYARSLVLAVTGSLMALVFLTATIVALAERSARGAKSNLAAFSMLPSDFWSWMAAAETASWRLKWAMIPLSLFVVFAGRKIYRSVRQSPARFCGVRYARNGYVASVAVPLLMLALIGITVPARLRHREWGNEAGVRASIYRTDRALAEYREKFGTLPSDPLKDLAKLPDADGSLAAALKTIDLSGYTINSEVAAVPTKKPQTLRGAVILKASMSPSNDEPLSGGLSFTNYELPLPGPDNLKGTDDDQVVRDGVIWKVSELPRRGIGSPSKMQPR